MVLTLQRRVFVMMGEQLGRQDRLFYEFCLDDRVPADHVLRRIDAVLDCRPDFFDSLSQSRTFSARGLHEVVMTLPDGLRHEGIVVVIKPRKSKW